MLREEMVVTSRRCKKCRWSTPYSNWTPPGEPKKPDTYYCMNDHVHAVTPDCETYSEPYDEEGEEE